MSNLKNELRTLRDENQKLRNDVERTRKDYTMCKTALVEIINLSSLSPTINDIAREAILNTGTRGCPAGLEGINSIFKNTKENN